MLIDTHNIKRLIKFSAVGASGILVNEGILYLLNKEAGIYYMWSSLLSIECAILSNFMLNYSWTWRDRRGNTLKQRYMQFLKFNITAGVNAFVFNWGMLVFLKECFGMDVLVANIAGIGTAFMSNFIITHIWVFRTDDI